MTRLVNSNISLATTASSCKVCSFITQGPDVETRIAYAQSPRPGVLCICSVRLCNAKSQITVLDAAPSPLKPSSPIKSRLCTAGRSRLQPRDPDRQLAVYEPGVVLDVGCLIRRGRLYTACTSCYSMRRNLEKWRAALQRRVELSASQAQISGLI